MSVIPTISITAERFSDDEAEEATESTGLNINDAHTDIEDLDSDKETGKGSTIKRKSLSLGVKKTKCDATDVEDMNTSGSDDNEDKIPIEDIKISLEEFLDQPHVDESVKYSGQKQHMSDAPRTNPSSSTLGVYHIDQAILTDCENLNASDDDEESDGETEDDGRIIVLEEANNIACHDSVKTDPGRFSQSPIHMTTTGESTSSSTESPTEEQNLLRVSPKKGCKAKRNRAPVSDTENIMFSDEEVHRKKCNRKLMPLILDGWEEVTIQLSDGEDDSVKTPMTPMYPEIDITFAEKKEDKRTKQKTMLLKVEEVDDGHTDVENLNSSDDEDDDEGPAKTKLIPSAIIQSKVGFLTDTEDIDEVESELDDTPEVSLPTPSRELVEVREGQQRRQVIRPTCGESLGLTAGYIDKGLTDVEDLSDAEDIDDSASKYVIDKPPQLDIGSVHVSEKMSSHLKPESTDLDPLTDTEELCPATGTGRRRKHKHRCSARGKQKHLEVKSNTNLKGTDVEELDMSDPEGFKEVRKPKKKTSIAVPVIVSTDGAKTDVEYVSADDNPPEYNWHMTTVDPNCYMGGDNCVSSVTESSAGGEKKTAHHVPVIRKTSLVVDSVCLPHTDIEDIGVVSDPENDSYSRAQTATPFEVQQTLDDASSTIHDRTQNAFDVQTEKLNIKGHRDAPDVYTDVEYVDEDANKE
ncbi:hypothetical protein DMENIID0001_080950 [Sergentomyia squamirostris]